MMDPRSMYLSGLMTPRQTEARSPIAPTVAPAPIAAPQQMAPQQMQTMNRPGGVNPRVLEMMRGLQGAVQSLQPPPQRVYQPRMMQMGGLLSGMPAKYAYPAPVFNSPFSGVGGSGGAGAPGVGSGTENVGNGMGFAGGEGGSGNGYYSGDGFSGGNEFDPTFGGNTGIGGYAP